MQHTTSHTTAVQSPSHFQWYILIGLQWYQLPEFIPSNFDSVLHRCISISIENWQRRNNLKSKNKFIGSQHRTTLPTFCPPKPHFRPRGPENSHNNPTSVLNVRKSPKFSHLLGNWDGGTWQWRRILDRKWKYGHFAQAHTHTQPFYCTTGIYPGPPG